MTMPFDDDLFDQGQRSYIDEEEAEPEELPDPFAPLPPDTSPKR